MQETDAEMANLADTLLPVTRSSMPSFQEFVDEVAPLWETHWLTNMGVKHRKLEAALRDYLDVDGVALFCNGHQALECVLEALELGHDGRRKVITTPFTFASTTHAICRVGLEPVFADIRADDCTIDPASVEALIDDEVCAILPVHVYGNLCDDAALRALADRHELKLVYDAAHAFGVRQDGVSAAALGDASMFSFHATKVFNTIEGGAVCFADSGLKGRLDQWKNFGITSPEDVEYVGGNAKMNEFCAAMGLCNLRHVEEEIAKRRAVYERYQARLGDVEGLHLCVAQRPGRELNHAYLPVIFQDAFGCSRDEVFRALAQAGIKARKYFYPLTTDFACYKGRFDSSATPVARDAAARVLTLPMYADLALEDVDRICAAVLATRD